MADVERQWEAGCVPHGAREVDGSGADAEGGFRHPQPSAADVERERVTALWREAAAALEPGDYFRDPESGEYVYAADEPSAPKPCAECGRLREQLDALEAVREIAEEIRSRVMRRDMEIGRARMWERDPGEWTRYERLLSEAVCAALGVEGAEK